MFYYCLFSNSKNRLISIFSQYNCCIKPKASHYFQSVNCKSLYSDAFVRDNKNFIYVTEMFLSRDNVGIFSISIELEIQTERTLAHENWNKQVRPERKS